MADLADAQVFTVEDGSRLHRLRSPSVADLGVLFDQRQGVLEKILLLNRVQEAFHVRVAVADDPH